MSAKKFYLTTPIYYVNARPHIGHAYTTIVADVLARRHRLLGEDTYFLTGTDEHGQKIERSAAAAGVPPQQFADEVAASFEGLWKRMGITYDQFIRTTRDKHKFGAQKLFADLYKKGFIYLDSYTGQYSVGEEMFVEGPPTLAAMAYKYTIGQPFIYPKNSLSFAENFLNMCFAVPCEDYKINPVLAEALDKIFILHADHEQNASTSTVRIAGSSGANPFACIAAGIACLWGPAHGGANEAALAMLAGIGTVDKIPDFIKKVKDKNSEVRLMGFGHRVYKNYDPRAKIMQKMCHAVLAETGHGDDPMLKVALELEKIALHDDYFIERKLYPNVDFYSGITLKAMGFPTSMFTVLFAVARTVGWISQWSEMIEDPQQKIGRPRQLYTGAAHRDYVDIAKRK